MRNRASLDNKDMRIVRALDKYGPKTTTKDLSKRLKIPPRTLRYRLSRLRSHGYLQPFRYSTREKKIGLGENILVLDLSSSSKPFPTEFFEKTQAVGWYSSTYGTMNGFLANVVYPLENPTANLKILEVLRDAGAISDYLIFDLFSYTTKGWNFSGFDSNGRWIWNWRNWHQQIDSILENEKSDVKLDVENQTQIAFDSKDVSLLQMLHENPNVTQKQISLKLELSISHVRRRIQRLENHDVIQGYKPIFTPFRDTLTLICFIESISSIKQILACMYELPYTLDIFIESPSKVGLRIRLSANDIVGFFSGLDRLRHLMDSLSVQILHNAVSFGSSRLYDLYDATNGKWMTHSSAYFRWLKDLLGDR
ncbi:MAG: winged helix-turn-helix transcriptional regulator [Candidatus Thorarchaeota archaeon SMTZ1-45]